MEFYFKSKAGRHGMAKKVSDRRGAWDFKHKVQSTSPIKTLIITPRCDFCA